MHISRLLLNTNLGLELWISLHLLLVQVFGKMGFSLGDCDWLHKKLHTQHIHTQFISKHRRNISHEVNLCNCEASIQLSAILSSRLKKKKKNIQAALIQMLGCHDFQNEAGRLTKFL